VTAGCSARPTTDPSIPYPTHVTYDKSTTRPGLPVEKISMATGRQRAVHGRGSLDRDALARRTRGNACRLSTETRGEVARGHELRRQQSQGKAFRVHSHNSQVGAQPAARVCGSFKLGSRASERAWPYKVRQSVPSRTASPSGQEDDRMRHD
jgi:hypothetical protein